MASSIRIRHSRRCPTATDPHAACKCPKPGPSYRAAVYDARSHKWLTKTFRSRAAAKGWRADVLAGLRQGRDMAPSTKTLREACEAFLAGAEAGLIHSRHRAPYKPSALRGYRRDLERYVLPALGAYRLSDLRRRDFRSLKERLLADGLSGQKVRNIFCPDQAVLRRAVQDEQIAVNPISGLDLPEPSGRRERSVSPEEVDRLLTALPDDGLRALYATVYLSGLRRGELRALRFDAVDFAAGVIEIRKSWDDVAGEISPKSKAGIRRVPMGGELRRVLIAHKLATGRSDRDFVFGPKRDRPFIPTVVRRKAITAWNAANAAEIERAEKEQRQPRLLVGVGLHELRHGYVSWMFDAGFSLERIGDYIGHSSASMTNAYRHLLEGHESEAAAKQDEYLATRATRTASAEA